MCVCAWSASMNWEYVYLGLLAIKYNTCLLSPVYRCRLVVEAEGIVQKEKEEEEGVLFRCHCCATASEKWKNKPAIGGGTCLSEKISKNKFEDKIDSKKQEEEEEDKVVL